MAISHNAHAADITAEAHLFKEIGQMMIGVAGRIERGKLQVFDIDLIAVMQNVQPIFRHGQELAPQLTHQTAINARRA